MKKIGIVGHIKDGFVGITAAYIEFFSNFGEVSVISPFERTVRDLDLLVLPGGPDVDPLRYIDQDEDINISVGRPCMNRERFDRVLLPQYIKKDTPIFGICRGHQTFYVQMGGKLIQDMYHETNDYNRKKLVHEIKFQNKNVFNGELFKLVNTNKKYEVNSIHHQIVDIDNKPDIATVIANHVKEEKHVEALSYYPYYPAYTVQWHPEEIYDEFSILLIRKLLGYE